MLRHNPHSAVAASSDKELEQTANSLQSTLNEFGLHSRVVGWISGPTVTTFKVQPGEGERVSRISNLEDDIALSLAAQSVHSRVVGWISGPTVTTFKVQPGEGERVSRISNLEDDIALSLAAQSVRIFAPIPGTSLAPALSDGSPVPP